MASKRKTLLCMRDGGSGEKAPPCVCPDAECKCDVEPPKECKCPKKEECRCEDKDYEEDAPKTKRKKGAIKSAKVLRQELDDTLKKLQEAETKLADAAAKKSVRDCHICYKDDIPLSHFVAFNECPHMMCFSCCGLLLTNTQAFELVRVDDLDPHVPFNYEIKTRDTVACPNCRRSHVGNFLEAWRAVSPIQDAVLLEAGAERGDKLSFDCECVVEGTKQRVMHKMLCPCTFTCNLCHVEFSIEGLGDSLAFNAQVFSKTMRAHMENDCKFHPRCPVLECKKEVRLGLMPEHLREHRTIYDWECFREAQSASLKQALGTTIWSNHGLVPLSSIVPRGEVDIAQLFHEFRNTPAHCQARPSYYDDEFCYSPSDSHAILQSEELRVWARTAYVTPRYNRLV